MEVPGDIGWNLIGDKTIEFARFPHQFIQDRITKYDSKVFISRLLNKPTVFVTSNQGVKEILHDKCSSFRMGYKDFGYMHNLYGDLFIFEDDESAYRVRKIIKELFLPQDCQHYMKQIEKITKEKLDNFDRDEAIDVYQELKDLATSIFLYIFLDIKDGEEYNKIKCLTTLHWHGLLSFPMSMKIKGWANGYSKAEEAKINLLQLIHDKLQDIDKSRFMQLVSDAGFEDESEAAIHVLLFISALIPKALGSLLTSFVYEAAGNEKKEMRDRLLQDEEFHTDILLETQRLWPPFCGGRRYAKEDVTIDGYHIPAGYSVAYISRYANRDGSLFEEADTFLPDRWKTFDSDKRHLIWTFGGGARCCVGISLVNHIYKHVTKYLSMTYDWSIVGNTGPVFKTLPIARPKDPLNVLFVRKEKPLPKDDGLG